jgi:hypothetical protein
MMLEYKKSLLLLIFLTCVVVNSVATVRIGVFIGNDYGLRDEKPLMYASRDAQEMARLMQQFGGLDQDRTYLIVNSGIDRVRHSLQEISGRLKELHRNGTPSMLLFYYSGHGSSGALHIANKKFAHSELTALLDSLDCDLKIAIVDACESGDLLRQKGARVVENHNLQTNSALKSKGTIIISSSSRGELAQESEVFQGSVFSHHLMNGLRGMADYNSDKQVGLMEVFNYASTSTRKEKSFGQTVSQHPTFDFDIVSHSDIVLTELQNGKSGIRFNKLSTTYVEIYNAASMALFARVYLDGKDSSYVTLPSNRYICTFVQNENTYVKTIDLTWGKNVSLSKDMFSRKPNLTLYAKGGALDKVTYHGAQISIRKTRPVLEKDALLTQCSYVFRSSYLRHDLLIGTASQKVFNQSTHLANELQYLRLGYALKYSIFRFVYGQILAGGEIAWHRAHQTVTDLRIEGDGLYVDRIALPKHSYAKTSVYQLHTPVDLELFLPFGIWGTISAGGSLYRFRDGARGMSHSFAFEPGFSIGYQF